MYQKYNTEALVLKSYEQGEADKVFALFTRDFGLVRARATAVRTERSKMRYTLQTFSRAEVSLVRGKRGWRVAGARTIHGAARGAKGVAAFARVCELALRLIHGEEQNEYLFAALAEGHEALMREGCNAWPTIEVVCVARVLYALGYISADALETTLFAHTGYGDAHLSEAERLRDRLLLSINRAIEETQL